MGDETVDIDGSMGEGGGQIVRTALALSMVTGRPVRIGNIRAGRRKPGLQRQHLAAVKAAEAVSGAAVRGGELGSMALAFTPGEVRGGEYRFAVGSAGSTTLVLQTVLPPLMLAKKRSILLLEGGTHNPWAPPADYLEKIFLPVLGRIGPVVTMEVQRYGFYPAGGGLVRVSIEPAGRLERVELLHRGALRGVKATALVARLPEHIGEREIGVVREELGVGRLRGGVRSVDSHGPGNILMIEMVAESATEMVTAFGERGVPAEEVARGAVKEAKSYLAGSFPVGPHLADQLLLPMALAGGGAFRTSEPTSHALTNIEVIRRFLPVAIHLQHLPGNVWEVQIGPRPSDSRP